MVNNSPFFIACFGIMFALFQAVFLLFISGIRRDISEAKNDMRDIARSFSKHVTDHAAGVFDCPMK